MLIPFAFLTDLKRSRRRAESDPCFVSKVTPTTVWYRTQEMDTHQLAAYLPFGRAKRTLARETRNVDSRMA